MKRHVMLQRYVMLLLITLVIPVSSVAQQVTSDELQKQYRKAIDDAQYASPDEIVDNLIDIVRCNSNLEWDDKPDGVSRVRMSRWINKRREEYYKPNEGKFINVALDDYPFVTVVPEVKKFCRDKTNVGKTLTLRLEQLLGLPQNSGKVAFVELLVEPKDLFRPCPDPEITDRRCELDFPRTGMMTVNLHYVSWFDRLYSQSYGNNPYPFPWTRLGYTYDWGNLANHVGPSEFVIMAGARVKVASVKTTEEYCAN